MHNKHNGHIIRAIVISLWLVVPDLSYGQHSIHADTISMDCSYNTMFREKTNVVMFSSQAEFAKADFSARDGDECMPFADIDFKKYVLVGFRYSGSNCHRQVQRSAILKQGDAYVIQLSIVPSVCRDLSVRTAWFIVDKPEPGAIISVERVIP